MKIKYEREQRGTKVFTRKEFEEREKWFEKDIRPNLKGTPKDLPYMQFLFYNTKDEFKDDQLFEENEIIKIRQNSFEQILEKLESYNLSDTQDDVKGIAFEQFLGTTFRGELGQYFTPRTIVDFMTNILDPNEGETVCDPTCGSGGFLIKAFEYMREKIEDDVKEAKAKLRADIEGDNYEDLSEKKQLEINERIEKMQATLNKELDTKIEDIIINSTGEGTLGRASVIISDEHVGLAYDSHMLLLRVNSEEIDPLLWVYLFNSPLGQKQVDLYKSAQATKQTELGIENTKKIKFPLPSLNVQKSLSALIEKETLSIKEQRRQANELYQQAKSIFEEVIFGE